MAQKIHEYTEAIGKTVAKVTVTNESDWRNITVKFTDNTAIHFGIRPFIQIEPEHVDWTTGNGKILRSYPLRLIMGLSLRCALAISNSASASSFERNWGS
jgi:hypothetical protein